MPLSSQNSTNVEITIVNPVSPLTVIDDAVVTGRIDAIDNTVIVPSFSMSFVALSAGIYRATIPPNINIVDGQYYKIVIDSTGSDGLIGHWVCAEQALAAKGCQD